ncbi:hypothetical protein K505DRAFT_322258 [Melanomma pulvis-pyrius CBS 109.77]|uniref:Pal1-domain-containing protein n=1 Tax=Melanomma pulvis-pyrius CBS 109.77 TaxID=1314802 RepID=A0A6A6XNF4_9PLEO|nr:hypothetical protein K505DRAFT_322258 [Melanomma pulvis-pyrius CBS 109.77]
MGSDADFNKAHHSIIDPLIELDPSEETGLNTHFRSTFAPRQNPPSPPGSAGLNGNAPANIRHHHTGSSVETNPYRRSRNSSVSKGPSFINESEKTPRRRHEYPSPPNSASPRREHFSAHRSEAFGSMNEGRPRRSSQPSSSNPFKDGGLTRGGSLRERYPGDTSNRPLDVIRKDTTKAYRAHHLRKKNFQGADTIDRLDKSTYSYHHEGPYDAANLARNMSWKHSPVAAVRDSNEEALRATPRENIIDAVTKHRPLEGTAVIPPGVEDKFGRVLDYEEGADLMREPGADYKRWPGQTYLPGDLKGKGEPSYSIDKAIKDHKKYGDEGMELQTHRRNRSLGSETPGSVPMQSLPENNDTGLGRSSSTGKSMGSALRKRFGSLRRRKAEPQA